MTLFILHIFRWVLFVLVLFLLYPVGSLHAFDQGHFDSPFVETVTAEVLEDQQSFVEGGYDVRIASLPLADVSTDNNGINLEMTHELADTLVSRGVDLVPEGRSCSSWLTTAFDSLDISILCWHASWVASLIAG